MSSFFNSKKSLLFAFILAFSYLFLASFTYAQHLAGNAEEVVVEEEAEKEAPVPLGHKPSFGTPEWIKNQTIYEVNVRQYSEAGTFDAVADDFERIKDLGATVLWLMPIHPIGEVNRKGTLGSYYSIKDYKGINPEFGDKKDFRNFMKKAHKMGFKVILDWVANHSAWDNPLTKTNPEFYATDETGTFVPPFGFDWTDVIQFDFTHKPLWDYQLEAMAYWVEEFNVDGFRCDYATGVPTEFWDFLSENLLKLNPDLFLLAEAEVGNHQLDAFHASYGWQMHHALNEVWTDTADANKLSSVLSHYAVTFPEDATFLHMTSNHDENSWQGTVAERLGAFAKGAALLTFTLEGIPLIYNGQEAGMDKRLEFFERDPIEWKDHSFFEFYETLIDLRKEHPALHTGSDFERLPTSDDSNLFFHSRSAKGKQILVLVNTSDEAIEYAAVSDSIDGNYKGWFTGKKYELDGVLEGKIEPFSYKVLVR